MNYLKPVLIWPLALVLLFFLIGKATEEVSEVYQPLKNDLRANALGNDFSMFYTGSEIVTSGRRDVSYDSDVQVAEIINTREGIDQQDHVWLRWYNPPIYLAAFSPLTTLSVEDAYLASVGINVGLCAVLCLIMGFILKWKQPYTLLICVALFAFSGTRVAVYHAQPTILIACFAGLGYLALRNGRTWLAGAMFALMGVKPHWLAAVGPLVLRRPRLIIPSIVAGVGFLVLPFIYVGPEATIDYVNLILNRGGGDVSTEIYSETLLSWNGFFRAYTGEVQPTMWLVAAGATLAVLGYIFWVKPEDELILLAGTLAALLAIPHSNPQDWVLVFPAAAAALTIERVRIMLVPSLVAMFFASTFYVNAYWEVYAGETAIYWLTPAAFLCLIGIGIFSAKKHTVSLTLVPQNAIL